MCILARHEFRFAVQTFLLPVVMYFVILENLLLYILKYILLSFGYFVHGLNLAKFLLYVFK